VVKIKSYSLLYKSIKTINSCLEIKMKKCPYCREEIEDGLVKCNHCGETIEGLEKITAKSKICPKCSKTYDCALKECPQCNVLLENWETDKEIIEELMRMREMLMSSN